MSCNKGGFLSISHNDLRDLTARIVPDVCKDTEIEPKLLLYLEKNFVEEQQIDQMR